MNKRKVEALLPMALAALNDQNCSIQQRNEKKEFTGKIDGKFRSQISSFGAAVTMGSFKAAVAFFSKKGNADVERSELIRIMYYLVCTMNQKPAEETQNAWKPAEKIMQEILAIDDTEALFALKEDFINASIAVKLALNAFELT